MSSTPSIAEWFRNRNVLVTGATGFMGKVLVSKLLTSCPEIGQVLLLIRDKKGVESQARFTSFLQQEPFKLLRQDHPERLKKVKMISGDTTTEGLGLSPSDITFVIAEVSVIFHMAANVKFDMPLKTAVTVNTKGTAHVLAVAQQMTQLQSFIHVSTAYCQCGEDVLEEKAYTPRFAPEYVFSIIDKLDDETLEGKKPKLLGPQPNTYAFSKSLSENLVTKAKLPIGVARPSVVGASWKEPTPGWIESMNGPTGVIVGAGKGVIRSVLCNKECLTDIVPCDMAVNATIGLAWKVGLEQPSNPIFMNVTVSGENPLTWEKALETGRKHAMNNPFSVPLWYPGGNLTSSKIRHWLVVIFLQLIPAYLLDTLLILTGNKPFLVRIQKKVSVGLELLHYYTTKEWIFRNDTLKDLRQQMTPSDRETFFTDPKALQWDDYLLAYVLGIRKFCLKDDPSTLPRARRVFAYLYVADICVKIMLGLLFAWFVYSRMMPTRVTIGTVMQNGEL